MKPILAIDPGASGGIAWCEPDGNVWCIPMPDTFGDLVDALTSAKATGYSTAFVEEVGGFCGVGQPGSAMFKFGKSCGVIEGALMALRFRIELVKPQKWQKHFGLGTTKQAGGKADWKRKLKAEAQRRFPTCDVTLKTADALLILDYARAQEVGRE
jgi:hypothetical protein